MLREEKVVNFYVICEVLKDTIRTGWLRWNVKKERVESIAEHIYSVQMLAIAMKSEYEYDVDLSRVILMLAIHELGETIIGDYTPFEISAEEKKRLEHQAVHSILGELLDGAFIEQLFLEFDEKQTKEAIFAFQCDKFQADIQSKLYDQDRCVDMSKVEDSPTTRNQRYAEILKKNPTWSGIFLNYDREAYKYDENFTAVSNYVEKYYIKRNRVILGTGNYDNVKSGNTVSITGDGGKAWGYTGKAYKKLAPKLVTYTPFAKGLQDIQDLLKVGVISEFEYQKYYNQLVDEYMESYYLTRLKDMDVHKTEEELLKVTEGKKNIIFLCHEPVELFCHRRVDADYWRIKTGVYIPEIKVDENGLIQELTPIDYTERLERIIRKNR